MLSVVFTLASLAVSFCWILKLVGLGPKRPPVIFATTERAMMVSVGLAVMAIGLRYLGL